MIMKFKQVENQLEDLCSAGKNMYQPEPRQLVRFLLWEVEAIWLPNQKNQDKLLGEMWYLFD